MDLPPTLVQRQLVQTATGTGVPDGFIEENGRFVPFWYTRTGIIVKWSVFLGLMVLFTTYILFGYMHAKKRIRKGLPPLAYHRWLVSRAELARVDPRYAYPQPLYTSYRPAGPPAAYGQQQQQFNMQANMPPPPPMYDPNGRPPMYDDPANAPAHASKVAPNQGYAGGGAGGAGDGQWGAPPGPPPASR